MAQTYSNSTDRLLAELPAERALRASARAWELFQADRTGYLTLYDATVKAVAELRAEPAPAVVEFESATRPGLTHRVDLVAGTCTCEAFRLGRRECWHVKAARQQQQQAAA
jgi:hypothetical protein